MAKRAARAGQTADAGLARVVALVTERLNKPGREPLPAPEGTLAQIATRFGLTPFETAIVALCAASELSADTAKAIGVAHGDPERTVPTFGLAITHLPEPHWDALRPDGPLRQRRLVLLGDADRLTGRPLRLAETVLHALMGVATLDPALLARVRRLWPSPDRLAAAHEAVQATLTDLLREDRRSVHLVGDLPAARMLLAAAAGALDRAAWALSADALPVDPEEREGLLQLWARDALLTGGVLLVELGGSEDSGRVADVLAHTPVPLVLGGPERVPDAIEPTVPLTVPPPTWTDRVGWWRIALGEQADEADVGSLAATFTLSAAGIRSAAAAATHDSSLPLHGRLWRAAGTLVRPRLEDLATRVDVRATLQDLVVPDHDRATLDAIVAHLRHRQQVWYSWGFAGQSSRGQGTTAVFAGPSGTGKSMAAEAIAGALALDLYRIDLSAVVSKFIGETEKNLRRIFDAAEDGGAVLLFDEADALFGKRTEVKDSHDRHANIEVSYLLQRMESYQGLAVLTTNLRRDIDDAFLRRFQFVIDFVFPDAAQREQLWRRAFPAATPLHGVDPARLSRLAITGGHIRNIARNAAFLAAADGGVVRMGHLLEATRHEYAKLGQPLTPTEIRSLEGR